MSRLPVLLSFALLLIAPPLFAQQPLPPSEMPPPAAVVVPAPPPAQAPPVPPPVVVPPPPVYAAPTPYGYAAPPTSGYAAPPRLYHEESQPRYGLIIAGGVVLGASWSINAAAGYMADQWKLEVPVLGPFLETQNVDTSSGHEANRVVVTMLIFDGMVETAGAAMLLVGVLTRQQVRVYDRVSLLPTIGPGLVGLAATTRF